jgi:hypothetical protein
LFEAVATIWALATKQSNQASCRVGDEEEQAKAFVLPDMNLLVCTKDSQYLMALPEDDVTECDACEPKACCPAGKLVTAGGQGDLERVPYTLDGATQAKQWQAERQANGAARQCPKQPKRDDHSLWGHMRPNAELTGRRRVDARPARCMMNQGAARAWWPAAGAPVERPVRRHSASSAYSSSTVSERWAMCFCVDNSRMLS